MLHNLVKQYGKFTVLLFAAILSACLLDSDDGKRKGSDLGYLSLKVELGKNPSVLGKSATADTLFYLDSIKVILTAPGAATQTYAYAIQGRPDTGQILAGTAVYGLAPLRTWKAKIFTIDTTLNPTRSDTVHMDSVSFDVMSGDTVSVVKTVNAAVSVLRIRMLSTTGDSMLASIAYLRVKINGVTRDSIFPNGATYNGVYYANLATAWAVSDSGWIYKTSDSGTTWIPQTSGISSDLNSTAFTSTLFGLIVGDGGAILRTTNGGTNWLPKVSGTTQNLRKVIFGTPAKAYAVGDGGVMLKSIDSGNTWSNVSGGWFSQTSPNSANLSAVHFTAPATGWAAGASGNILRTTNSGVNWTAQQVGDKRWRAIRFSGLTGWAVGDSGKIIKTTDGAAWTPQTSPTTEDQSGFDLSSTSIAWSVGSDETILNTTDGTNWRHQTGGWFATKTGTTGHLNSINMGTGAVGYAVGDAGFVTKSTDGGITWTPQTPAPTAQDLNTVYVLNANTATAVGQNGALAKTNSAGSAWATRSSNTTQHLKDLDMVSATQGWAVGDSETITRTADSVRWGTMPGVWTKEPTGVTDTLNAIRFFDGRYGWAVGNGGRALRTRDGGNSWVTVTSGVAQNFRGVHATSITTAVLIGDNGTVRRTTDTGGTWSTINIATNDAQRALFLHSATVGFMVGDSGTIRRTADGGATWAAQALSPVNSGALLRSTHSNGTYVWTVGVGGVIYYRNAVTAGAHTRATNARTTDLNDVYVMTSAVVVAVGQNGTILRTTNGTTSGGTWNRIDSGLTNAHLRSVWFKGTTGTSDTGYIVGDGGVILESNNSGASWFVRSSGTTENLNVVHVRPGAGDSILIAGSNGTILRTINGGFGWTGKSPLRNFNGVDFFNAATGYIVASDGRVLRTTTGGTRWVVMDSIVTTPLNGVYFRSASTGWVVGNSGIIRRTNDSGKTWTPQGSGFGSYNFLRVHFNATSDTGWIAGEGGVLVKTTDGGSNWAQQVVSTGQPLRGVFMRNRDTVFAAGDSGNIFKTNNGGVSFRNLATRVDLKDIYFVPTTSTAYAVGTLGTILKTTNSGTTWDSLPSGINTTLNAVIFPTDVTTGHAAGAGGKILKTTNGGTSWTSQTVGSDDFTEMHFSSATQGFAVAKTGKIYRTTNTGGAWTLQSSGTTEDLAAIFATNNDTVFAVGNNGTILKTRDSGMAKTTADLKSVHYIGDTGFVVGAGGVTLRTFNGAATWTPVTGTTTNLNDVFFTKQGSANGQVYSVGDAGTLVMASTLTSNWTTRPSGTTQKLNAVHIAGAPRIYLVGDSGIVRTATGFPLAASPTWIVQPTKTTESLRSMNCFPTMDTCLFVGTNESVVKTDDGASTVYVFKSSGARRFDRELTYKYLPTQKPNIILLQAIDRPSPLRGFEFADTLTLGAGQDTTLSIYLKRCGGSAPACTP